MLSPHELAALMHILNGQEHSGLNPNDLDALVDRCLIRLETQVHNRIRPFLTSRGHDVLNAICKDRR